ncbi:MAG: helix-turn-helix transcriptional regulator [Erythrobacter sp.]
MRIRKLIAGYIARRNHGVVKPRIARPRPSLPRHKHAVDSPDTELTSTTRRHRREGWRNRLAALRARRARRNRRFAAQVDAAIVPLLAAGEIGAAQVAISLGISRQTLFRRLRDEGTSFTELLDARRRKLAIRYIGRERMPVKVAAWRLGFSSPAAFSRAFKRWTGSTPGRFRNTDA